MSYSNRDREIFLYHVGVGEKQSTELINHYDEELDETMRDVWLPATTKQQIAYGLFRLNECIEKSYRTKEGAEDRFGLEDNLFCAFTVNQISDILLVQQSSTTTFIGRDECITHQQLDARLDELEDAGLIYYTKRSQGNSYYIAITMSGKMRLETAVSNKDIESLLEKLEEIMDNDASSKRINDILHHVRDAKRSGVPFNVKDVLKLWQALIREFLCELAESRWNEKIAAGQPTDNRIRILYDVLYHCRNIIVKSTGY